MKNIVEIEEMITIPKSEYELLKQQVAWLMEQLKLSKKQQFGVSSEKSEYGQLSLFGDEEQITFDNISESETKEIKAYTRRKSGCVGIDKLPKNLPVEIIEHRLPESEQNCPDCDRRLHVIGNETRKELKFIPAKAVIINHVTYTYACRNCEKTSDHVPVIKAKSPNPVIKGSFASPEAVAHIAYEKFVMGSPLYRQQQDWERKGIPLSRQSMSNWLNRVAIDWLSPIYDRMHQLLCFKEVAHADETTVQVLHEPDKSAQSKSYMWLYRTSGEAKNPIILYEYQPSRAGEHPAKFLENFRGYLHTDGLAAYHCKLHDKIIVVGCWAHARRKFDDALKVLSKKSRKNSPIADALLQIGKLYKLEKEFQNLSPEDNFKARFEARQGRSKPLVDAFFSWCESQSVHGLLATAVNYCLSQRVWLEHYLIDGRLEIDNNRAERSIKPFVIGRKNWLFSNSIEGVRSSAVFYSIIETAKENNVNLFEYLAFVFRNAPNLDLTNLNYVDKLLPWNFNS